MNGNVSLISITNTKSPKFQEKYSHKVLFSLWRLNLDRNRKDHLKLIRIRNTIDRKMEKEPRMNIPWYRISLGEHWKGRREGKTEMAMLIYISYNALVNNKIYYTYIHHSALLLFKIRE